MDLLITHLFSFLGCDYCPTSNNFEDNLFAIHASGMRKFRLLKHVQGIVKFGLEFRASWFPFPCSDCKDQASWWRISLQQSEQSFIGEKKKKGKLNKTFQRWNLFSRVKMMDFLPSLADLLLAQFQLIFVIYLVHLTVFC